MNRVQSRQLSFQFLRERFLHDDTTSGARFGGANNNTRSEDTKVGAHPRGARAIIRVSLERRAKRPNEGVFIKRIDTIGISPTRPISQRRGPLIFAERRRMRTPDFVYRIYLARARRNSIYERCRGNYEKYRRQSVR